jgi:hypothetical protein
MQYLIKVDGFEGHQIAVTSDEFISNPKLLIDGQPAPNGQKRGEFIVYRNNGSKGIAQFTSASMGFDPVPHLTIDGKVIQIMPPLDWFEWVWSGIPLILFFVGGLLGVLCGIMAFAFNLRVFRTQRSSVQKLLLTALISLVSAGITYGLPLLTNPLLNLIFHKS